MGHFDWTYQENFTYFHEIVIDYRKINAYKISAVWRFQCTNSQMKLYNQVEVTMCGRFHGKICNHNTMLISSKESPLPWIQLPFIIPLYSLVFLLITYTAFYPLPITTAAIPYFSTFSIFGIESLSFFRFVLVFLLFVVFVYFLFLFSAWLVQMLKI